MRERSAAVRLALPLLLLLVLGCGPCGLVSGKTPTPPRPIVVSTEAAQQLESRIGQSIQGPAGQQFILRMTDQELTSLLATELAQYEDSPIVEPQVWFTKGKIYATGRLVNVLPVETPLHIAASARIIDRKVVVEIEDATAGTIPLPANALEMLSQSVSETVEELQLDVDITTLEILEGEAIIQGVRR